MTHRWFTLFTFGFIGVAVFILFALRLQPVRPPDALLQDTGERIEQPTVTFVNPAIGAENPKVVIVEFGDFLCESCRDQASSFAELLSKYPNDVRLVWKHFPNESIHPLASPAAIASQCAHDQGKFWEYHDLLFSSQAFLSEELFDEFAGELDLNLNTFKTCRQSEHTLPAIRKDFEEALALELPATPALFINGERIIGAISTQNLMTHVQGILVK